MTSHFSYHNLIKTLNLTVYRLTVIENMKTKVNRTIETVETVETEVEFPRYTADDFFYYKHYSEEHCVAISVINTFANISVTGNSKGQHLFDEEITESKFNEAMDKVLAMIIPELRPNTEAKL